MSERDTVKDYVWERAVNAWKDGDEEAHTMYRFFKVLDKMTDADYDQTFVVDASDIS